MDLDVQTCISLRLLVPEEMANIKCMNKMTLEYENIEIEHIHRRKKTSNYLLAEVVIDESGFDGQISGAVQRVSIVVWRLNRRFIDG